MSPRIYCNMAVVKYILHITAGVCTDCCSRRSNMAFITWIASASWASSKRKKWQFYIVLLLVFITLRFFVQMFCKWTEVLISVLDKGQLRMEIRWRLKRWTRFLHVPWTMSWSTRKLIMVSYLMNLTEISRLQILDNLFPQKKISTTMGEMLIVMPPTGISLKPLSLSHLSKNCYPMHLSPDFQPQSSIIWRLCARN